MISLVGWANIWQHLMLYALQRFVSAAAVIPGKRAIFHSVPDATLWLALCVLMLVISALRGMLFPGYSSSLSPLSLSQMSTFLNLSLTWPSGRKSSWENASENSVSMYLVLRVELSGDTYSRTGTERNSNFLIIWLLYHIRNDSVALTIPAYNVYTSSDLIGIFALISRL